MGLHRPLIALLLLPLTAGGGCRGCRGERPPPLPAGPDTGAAGGTARRVQHGAGPDWVGLAGGAFSMGRDGGDDDEVPAHRVELPAFAMTRAEITVAQYRRCVLAGACQVPGTGPRCNWARQGRGGHPVNCVTWPQAAAFCAWAGGALPSEAQWEFAARGGGRGQAYPWGDDPPDCQRAVMPDERGPGCGSGETAAPCSRPGGSSPQGLCDLAGNAWEWVADCWHKGYRGAPADGSPWRAGCKDPGRRVVRGSSFLNGTADNLRAASRDSSPAGEAYHSIGFRCARAGTPGG